MRGFPAGGKKGVANMQGVSAYVRDINLEIPSLDYPEIPDDLEDGGLTWTQDILLVAKPGFEIVINTDSPKVKNNSFPFIATNSIYLCRFFLLLMMTSASLALFPPQTLPTSCPGVRNTSQKTSGCERSWRWSCMTFSLT